MLLTVLYIIAITAEAMTGALSAGRRSMDLFGVVLIACARCSWYSTRLAWWPSP